ncbi:MAG: alpha-2-macroglobulin family protein [Alphaproteobacteria bacterium]|jgi:uncharacterized protein YfaS (alpha-2-macroglobulin family)|nr:alpha-2-macroglobulin family protein [Alphaproteobacteria bacterium]
MGKLLRRLVMGLLVLAVIAIAGLALDRVLNPPGPQAPQVATAPVATNPAPTQPPAAAPPAPAEPAATATPPATPVQTAAAPPAPPAPPPAPPEFAYSHQTAETTGRAPIACFAFNRDLVADGSVSYADYLQIDRDARPGVTVDGRKLCLSGLRFATDYTVTWRTGLPAAGGDKLLSDERVKFSFGDAKPSVSFAGNGFILPRQSAAGVTLDTVNVDTLGIKVYRVGDRNVVPPAEDDYYNIQSNRKMSAYTLKRFADKQAIMVWQGTMKVDRRRNETVSTIFPLGQALPQRQPGAYVVVARDAKAPERDPDDYSCCDDEDSTSVLWVIDTDIALTTLRGTDGMTVVARSLSSAKPLANVGVKLFSVSNDELGQVTTDKDGVATFAPGLLRGRGAAAPAMVQAFGGDNDFAAIDLKRPAFDLGDRGVSGRPAPGPLDAWLYADRGIYRPGETVHVVALLRDRAANAADIAQAQLVISRPNGVDYRRLSVGQSGAGAFTADVTLPDDAVRGLWSATLRIDGAEGRALGRLEFDVQDFVPQRLKVVASAREKMLRPGDTLTVDVDGAFLYGAPAAELAAEIEARIAVDTEPFPAAQGYRFGLFDDTFTETAVKLEAAPTDAQGKTVGSGKIEGLKATSRPLRATVSAGLFEPGGRLTRTTLAVPVRTHDLYVGVRPLFTEGRVQENSAARFEVRALDAEGRPVDRQLAVTVYRELWDYNWYRRDGQWQYEAIVRDRVLAETTLAATADKPAVIERVVDWGRYRLLVEDKQTGAATSLRFRAGWSSGGEAAETPDKVEVSVEQAAYKPGATAKVSIKPPFEGELMLAVAGEKIHSLRQVTVPKDGGVYEIPVQPDWGPGAYVLATLYRPLAAGREREPVRAVGVAWVGIDTADRQLAVAMAAPETMRPRSRLTVPVTVGNAGQEKVFLTLAAVDEGILQLTRYQSPSPVGYFFGKRRLGVDLRDDYARLLEPRGAMGEIRSGGDGIGGKGLPVVPTKTVALWSGLVEVGADGRAEIGFDVPDFNGQLRLMAVAHGKTKLGAAEGKVIVRDPVVAEISLPRFLAPGDDGRMTLFMHNLEGAAGDYQLKLAADGAVSLPSAAPATVTLARDARKVDTLPLKALGAGIGRVAMTVSGPDGWSVTREWKIAVRSPYYPLTVEQVAAQKPGERWAFDPKLLDAFEDGASVSIGYSPLRGIDVAGIMQSLDRYPYGCSEQLTSKAMPLLSFSDPALLNLAAATGDAEVKNRVQQTIDKLLERQDEAGNIGLWRLGDEAPTYVQVYVADFLDLAKRRGFVVPDFALARAMDQVRRIAAGHSEGYMPVRDFNAEAYAGYLLARANRADIGDLRYFHDAMAGKLKFPLPLAELGAALALMGDQARATSAFGLADQGINRFPAEAKGDFDWYRTRLRDIAGAVTMAAESRQSDRLRAWVPALERAAKLPDAMTTQEKAWSLRAASALLAQAGALNLAVDGVSQASSSNGAVRSFRPDATALRLGFAVSNGGNADVWRTVSIQGSPKTAPPPLANGFELHKTLYNLQGEEIDPASVRQNDRIVISLTGKILSNLPAQVVLVDYLPAGFEIEAIAPSGTEDAAFGFLPASSRTRIKEARDDRFVAAFDLNRPSRYSWSDEQPQAEFNMSYLVRVVTPGNFVLPGAAVEDMYRPGRMARTAVGSVAVGQAR